MKIRLHLKDPDGVCNSIHDAVDDELTRMGHDLNDLDVRISVGEREDLRSKREEEVLEALEPWVEYEEYVSVEIDTVTGNSRVLRRGE